MIKSILTPIDGSGASFSALSNAVGLGKIADAEVRGLFVVDRWRFVHVSASTAIAGAIGAAPTTNVPLPPDKLLEEEKRARKEENDLKSRFTSEYRSQGVKGTFEAVRGEVSEVIIEAAKTVDIVVIGSHGKHPRPKRQTPGSITQTLLHKSARPVMVVPEGAMRGTHLLMAYDGSEASQRAMEVGVIITKLHDDSEIDVITVADNPDDAAESQEEAKKYLAPHNIKTSFLVRPGKPWEAISSHAREIDAGLIVMGAFGTNRLKELIFGSTTVNVLENAKCPVLLVA